MAMHVVFLGMECAASEPPLAALFRAGIGVRAVVLPGGSGEPATALEAGVAGLAGAARVPVLRVAGMGPGTVERIAAHRPDAVVVACFPWRLPRALRGVPRLGCLNVHPSLLPTGRGPEPVFWTLRRGERRTGPTVHRMDAGFDTGPIVARAEVGVPPGVRAPALERRLMALGGRLLAASLPRLAAGEIAATPQGEAGASRAPLPTADDWLVPTSLPGAWAYAFARGVAPLGGPLALWVGATGERYALRDALDHGPESMAEPTVEEGNGVLRVRFRPGWVRFRLG